MKRVDVLRISYYPPNKGYAVMLKEVEGERQVPIIVGSNEAQAIAMAIEGIELPRPMTHDLMLDIVHSLDVDIKHIVISDIRNGTFFAKITMTTLASGDVTVDSRPSDAIALAVRTASPIYASEEVLAEAGQILEAHPADEASENDPDELLDDFKQFLDDVSPDDFQA